MEIANSVYYTVNKKQTEIVIITKDNFKNTYRLVNSQTLQKVKNGKLDKDVIFVKL
jgi:hypothetical protein